MPNTEEIGIAPPQNIEAEQAVLGSMMIDATALHDGLSLLKAGDFYRPVHQVIFSVIADLSAKREPVDIITMKNALTDLKKLDKVGGIEYLMSVVDTVPTAANLTHYANIVSGKSLLRTIIGSCTEIIGMALKDQAEANAIKDALVQKAIVLQSDAGEGIRTVRDTVMAVWEKIEGYANGVPRSGIPFGIEKLDKLTYGIETNDLIIIGGRPSQGKTILCEMAALGVMKHTDKHCLLFSLETSREQLVERMVFMEARVDANKVRSGDCSEEEWERLAEANGRLWNAGDRIHISDCNKNITQLQSTARRFALQYDLGAVVVDYLQIVGGLPGRRSDNRTNEIQQITSGLRAFIQDTHIPVVVAAQLNRQVEQRTGEEKLPKIADLREGGNQEADATKIILIHNQPPMSEYEGAKSEGRKALFIVGKNKDGECGVVPVWFEPCYTRFDDFNNLDNQHEPPSYNTESAAGFVPREEED